MAEKSPVPKKPNIMTLAAQMSLPDALKEVVAGKSITRISWMNNDWCELRDGWLMIRREGKWHTWLINDGDLMADDWVTVSPNITMPLA